MRIGARKDALLLRSLQFTWSCVARSAFQI
jgi:hypothetical protein